jgi:NDP-sugar pyrophosphorylase family protein
MNGDILTTLKFKDLMNYHKKNRAAATISMHKKSVKLELGIIHTNGSLEVTGYTEKPLLNYQVSMGIYVFNQAVLNYVSPNAYLDFPDLILRLLGNKEKVMSFMSDDYWVDIGTHSEYEKALEEYEKMKKHILKK